ncbi:hypothetical protein GCM10009129_05500 [Psychrobacter aestuarii]|uniref:Uncharacterized protein n=1 Tax=Psychrobacter aestuarii TaxID=556327 RepID=A0ABP3FBY5_9GAMM
MTNSNVIALYFNKNHVIGYKKYHCCATACEVTTFVRLSCLILTTSSLRYTQECSGEYLLKTIKKAHKYKKNETLNARTCPQSINHLKN